MKLHYVIECDTEMYSVFVRSVKQEYSSDPDAGDKQVIYYHSANEPIPVMEPLGPKFYGHLDALLVTKGKIEDAAPVTPEAELNAGEYTIMDKIREDVG